MVTAHFPIGYEFEYQEDLKIIALNGDSAVHVMLAGDVLRGNEVLDVARTILSQKEEGISGAEVAEIVRQAYQDLRLTSIIHRELEPRGMNLDYFQQKQKELMPQVVQVIDSAMTNNDLGVQIIVAGHTGKAYTIHSIQNPGTKIDHSSMGHCAIGSGAPHAFYSLIEEGYVPSLGKDDVIDLLQKAKRRSEVAPGVGAKTSSVVIDGEDI